MVILAPMLIELVIAGLAIGLFPNLFAGMDNVTPELVRNLTLIMCVIVTLHFALVTYWSEHIGAGAFAGDMRASSAWIVAAAMLGPLCLIMPTLLVGSFFGGEENWIYSEDYNPAFDAPENQGLAVLFYAILLAPVVEEVVFRGVAMGAMLARGINAAGAVVVSSAAFTFIHGQYSPGALMVIFLAGLGFGALRILSGTIIVPIVAHMSANTVVTLLSS